MLEALSQDPAVVSPTLGDLYKLHGQLVGLILLVSVKIHTQERLPRGCRSTGECNKKRRRIYEENETGGLCDGTWSKI